MHYVCSKGTELCTICVGDMTYKVRLVVSSISICIGRSNSCSTMTTSTSFALIDTVCSFIVKKQSTYNLILNCSVTILPIICV